MEFGKITMCDPKGLKDRPGNTKAHTDQQIDGIVKSIRQLGFNDPIEVDRDGFILAGHGRKQAAIRAGITEVPVIYIDIAGVDADAYAMVHNETTLSTGMDMSKVVDSLSALGVDQDEAAFAGITAVEWEMNSEAARDTSEMYFGEGHTDESIKNLAPSVRRVILKFETEKSYKQWLRFMTWLKNAFPNEETTVERIQAYMAASREVGAK